MLPQLPRALNSGFPADSPADISQSGAPGPAPSGPVDDALPVDHHCQVCRLIGHRCKLVCTHCGYYLSCADYY
jgi:hypothetical protein